MYTLQIHEIFFTSCQKADDHMFKHIFSRSRTLNQADNERNQQIQKQYSVRQSIDNSQIVKWWYSYHYEYNWNQETAKTQQMLTVCSQSVCKNQSSQVYSANAWSVHVHSWLQQTECYNQKAAESESAFLKQNKSLAHLLIQKSSQVRQVSLLFNSKHCHVSTNQFTNWQQTAFSQWAQKLWVLSWWLQTHLML